MGNGNFDFNTQDLLKINTNISVVHDDITRYLTSIKEQCDILSFNLQSRDAGINHKIQMINDSIGSITNLFTGRVIELNKDFKIHMEKYDELAREATRLLTEALEFINDNFELKGGQERYGSI